jgi:integrase
MESGLSIRKDNTQSLLSVEEYSYTMRKNTRETYGKQFQKFIEFCQEQGYSLETGETHEEGRQIMERLLKAYISESATNYSISTVKTRFYAIVKALQYRGILINTQAFKELIRSKENKKIEERQTIRNRVHALTKDKILRNIDNLKKDYRDIVWLLYYGAFRVSELLSLMPQDIEVQNNGYKITIRTAKNLKVGKEHYKFIPKDTPAGLALKERLNNAMEGERLFTQTRNAVSMTITRNWKGYTAHSLRSGFITDAINKGASVEQVCSQTGQTLATAHEYYRQLKVDENNAVNLI